MAEATTIAAQQTLRDICVKDGLRVAQADELRELCFVVECQVCGEVCAFQQWMALPGYCYCCGLSWKQASPVFLVLIPASVPVPEES